MCRRSAIEFLLHPTPELAANPAGRLAVAPVVNIGSRRIPKLEITKIVYLNTGYSCTLQDGEIRCPKQISSNPPASPISFAAPSTARLGMAILCWKFSKRHRRAGIRSSREERALHLGTRTPHRRLGWRRPPPHDGRAREGAFRQKNFPPVTDTSNAAWTKTLEHLHQVHVELVAAVEKFPEKSSSPGPRQKGRHYTFYYMLHGIVQHELYHAGQIALLKKV